RLQTGDVVVGEVADDRLSACLRLLERAEARAAADEREPAETAALDRLEEERTAAPVAVAQPEERAERREQVGCDVGGSGHLQDEKTLRAEGLERGRLSPRLPVRRRF